MWNDSHADESWIDCLKRYIRLWKRRCETGVFSDAAICDEIVKAHNASGLAAKTGIRFAPGSADEYNRQKANAARIMRMLSDEPNTEFESVSLFNMLPSILSAMPADLRADFLNEYMAPLGLTARSIQLDDSTPFNPTSDLVTLAKEASEAQGALANLIDGATPSEMAKAERELEDILEAAGAALAHVRSQKSLKVVA